MVPAMVRSSTENDTTISTVDAQGVALAAIQGLYQENQDLKAQNAQLEARVSQLEQRTVSNNTQPQPEPFNIFNLISVVALIGFASVWLQQRRRQEDRS